MQTFDEIKYELYEKIADLLNNNGEKIIINVGNKEGTIYYNSFFIETTTSQWRSYLYPQITNSLYTDKITPVNWGKECGVMEVTGESAMDYWLRSLEEHFKKLVDSDISDLFYSFGNDNNCKEELNPKLDRVKCRLSKIEIASKKFLPYMAEKNVD